MRVLVVGGLAVCLAAGAWAQPRNYGSRSGFGNVVFPGTGHAPPLWSPFSITDPTFARRLGATISGFPPYTGAPLQPYRSGRRPAVVPWVYPVFAGGYYYGPGYEPAPSVIVTAPPQPAPQVVIHQYFGGESARSGERKAPEESNLRIYDAPARTPSEPAEASLTFLIATKDHSVFSAAAYWVEGEELHYVTPRGRHEKIPLASVDRQLSEKLNEGHQVEFRLPAAR